MEIVLIITLVVAAVADEPVTKDYFSDEYIDEVNSLATTWTAGRNFPEGTTLSQLECLMGSLPPEDDDMEIKEVDSSISEADIPESFDARDKWPQCPGIKTIQDQSRCGSCWAVAAASTISDRICVQTNGAQQTAISAYDIMTCCSPDCAKGCKGGYQHKAWKHWVENGIVTGGTHESGVGCKPYPYPACAHSISNSKYPKCPKDRYVPSGCEKKCSNSSIVYANDLQKGGSSYKVKGMAEMQKELMTNGPMEIGMHVYSDFSHYKSGVYQKTKTATKVGGHSIRLIGWGVEKGTPYWLAANSWNAEWGDKGTYKILRGNNHCNIESQVVAGKLKA